MLAFSRGMMGLPKLLIMDEPSWDWPPTSWTTYFSIAKEVAQESGFHYPGGTGCGKALRIVTQGIRD